MSDTSTMAEGEFFMLEQSWKSKSLEFDLRSAMSESAWARHFSSWALSSPWQTMVVMPVEALLFMTSEELRDNRMKEFMASLYYYDSIALMLAYHL